jgi:nicotinamide-nucleotide amidase
MKAAILSIGSELLSGQIINRNAPWLSAKLFELGIDTVFQMTVDDRIDQISEALDLARSKGALIFCTGGLGPTSDDLTREAVALWLKRPLSYHSSAWDHIEKIFFQFGTTPPETNKKQCYFPQDSEILTNSAGTAHGFCFRSPEIQLFVLPGPPHEIETIWRNHLHGMLSQDQMSPSSKRIFSWRTIGKGESHIAELVESVCQKSLSKNIIEIAYRAHAPYIETKIRFEKKDETSLRDSMDELTQVLSPWVYEKQDENWIKSLSELLTQVLSCPLEIHDFWSGGQIQAALLPYFTRLSKHPRNYPLMIQSNWEVECDRKIFFEYQLEKNQRDGIVSLVLCQADEEQNGQDSWMVVIIKDGNIDKKVFPHPYQLKVSRERQELAVAYLAIKFWAQNLVAK